MIIATAGHVDHGKTALIKALTGTNTDRLPEERARGLSIDLGFAYQSLSDNTTLGFVDVPGHEKFIRNMLAGVGGIDLGLLVVAADDGVMPQTREHFAILDLLGIDQCVVAITKIDRVDDDRIHEVQDQIETLLGNAGHADIDVYPVCAPELAGIAKLKQALYQRAQEVAEHPVNGHFRMAIDRAFSLKGVGLVATGMVFSGQATINDNLLISATAAAVRVRGIRAHNQVSDWARAGQRCALNIAGRGISEDSLKRGNWLLHPNLYAPTRRIDVNLSVLDSEPRALKHWTPTHLHIGADRLPARVAVLCGGAIAAGERGLAQLVLTQNAFVVHGDRFVLRDQTAKRTIAGGYVIDPFSPQRGRARPTRIAALRAIDKRNPGEALAALTAMSDAGVSLTPFSVSHNLTAVQIDRLIESLSLRRVGRQPQEWIFGAMQWQNLLKRIEQAVACFHQTKPASIGASCKDIQRIMQPYIETPILEQATRLLAQEKRLGRQGTRFHLPSHVIQVAEFDRQLWVKAAANLGPKSGSPLSLHQAAEALGIDRKILETSLKKAVKVGEMVSVTKNRYLPPAYMTRLGYCAESLVQKTDDGLFTVAEYCQQSGLGRNFAIELLEHFDRLGFTERLGNSRRIRQAAATVFTVDDEGS